MFDLLHADEIELSLPRSALSMGAGYESLDAGYRAILASVHLELVEYDTGVRTVIREVVEGHSCERVHIRLMGKLCVDAKR